MNYEVRCKDVTCRLRRGREAKMHLLKSVELLEEIAPYIKAGL